jgi:hypothetical protein
VRKHSQRLVHLRELDEVALENPDFGMVFIESHLQIIVSSATLAGDALKPARNLRAIESHPGDAFPVARIV